MTSQSRPCKNFHVPDRINQQLMDDLVTLSSKKAAGRRTESLGHTFSYQYITQRFKAIGLTSWQGNYTQRFSHPKLGDKVGVNILGWLEGQRYPEQYIVVTAHYDHLGRRGSRIFYGADDNASGVAMMLSLASYLKATSPDFSVIFVATDAEEKGLLGSEQLLASKIIPSPLIKLNINLDMVARSKRLYYLSSKPRKHEMHQKIRGITQACLINRRTHRSFSNHQVIDFKKASDHWSFSKAGIDFIFLGGGQHADYHTVNDVAQRISARQFSNRIAVVTQLFTIAEQMLIDEL